MHIVSDINEWYYLHDSYRIFNNYNINYKYYCQNFTHTNWRFVVVFDLAFFFFFLRVFSVNPWLSSRRRWSKLSPIFFHIGRISLNSSAESSYSFSTIFNKREIKYRNEYLTIGRFSRFAKLPCVKVWGEGVWNTAKHRAKESLWKRSDTHDEITIPISLSSIDLSPTIFFRGERNFKYTPTFCLKVLFILELLFKADNCRNNWFWRFESININHEYVKVPLKKRKKWAKPFRVWERGLTILFCGDQV